MWMSVFIVSLVLLIVALLFLSVKLLLKKGSRFPQTSVGHNEEMRKRGIYCARTQDALERKKLRKSE